MMVQYTPRSGIPYPDSGDSVRPQSRDLVALALAADAGIGDAVATAEAEARNVDNRVTGIAATMSADLAVQREHYEGMLTDNGTAYDVYVAQALAAGDPVMTRAQWLDSLKGQGDEGPYGGTAVTDPQVASMVSTETETRAALADGFVERHGKRGVTRTLYVRATGDDSNPGTSAAPFREIHAALDTLAADGPVIRGSVVIDVGPGTFQGGIRLPITRGAAQDDFVRIVGAQTDGVPTTRIVHTSGTGTGLLAEDGAAVWLENLKFVGGFSAAVQLTRNVYAWFTNVHIDGEGAGVRGFSISSHCRYYVRGGLIENLTYAGIDEYFAVSRSYATVSTSSDQLLIRDCRIGLRAKEGCIGHLDYLRVEDCETGIELLQNCVANLKGVELRRNATGLGIINSTSHNEGGVIWGEGDDANTREVYSAGASGELRAMMWTGEDMVTDASTGHRPLFVIGNDFERRTVTGEVGTELPLSLFERVLPRAFFRTVGKHFRVVLIVNVEGASSDDPVTIMARIGSPLLGSIDVRSNGVQRVEFDTVCIEDGVRHLTVASVTGAAEPLMSARRSSAVLSGVASAVSDFNTYARFSASGQQVELYSSEMWG